MNKKTINIAIIDDHPIVLEGLKKVLAGAYDYISTICFTNGKSFLDYLKSEDVMVDIVLLDISLPDINGLLLCKEIKLIKPEVFVLAFSNHNERGTIMQMLQQGASGYMLKNIAVQEMVLCIDEAMQGNIAFSSEVKEIMAKPTLEDFQLVPILTKREKEILKLIADGSTSVTIAEKLYLSPLTIETHRRNLMQKFGVKNTAAMIKAATKHHLI